MKPILSQEYLKSLLHYVPETGVFTWKVAHSGRVQSRDCAGNLTKLGYVRISIDGYRYMAHLLAWLYMTGEALARGIDHRDTVRSNNAWNNLRRATQSQQNMNANLRSDNQCGAKGVCRRQNGKYAAQIRLPGEARQRWLGTFDTVEEASAAYWSMAIVHFGDFARLA